MEEEKEIIKALVVDDSRIMRGMVKENLKKTELAEFEFTEAGDGAAAIDIFDPDKVDIIFVDWNMPKMNGIEFARQLGNLLKQHFDQFCHRCQASIMNSFDFFACHHCPTLSSNFCRVCMCLLTDTQTLAE